MHQSFETGGRRKYCLYAYLEAWLPAKIERYIKLDRCLTSGGEPKHP